MTDRSWGLIFGFAIVMFIFSIVTNLLIGYCKTDLYRKCYGLDLGDYCVGYLELSCIDAFGKPFELNAKNYL